jgi:hypothetical protein
MKKLLTILLLTAAFTSGAQNIWRAPSVFEQPVNFKAAISQTSGTDSLKITTVGTNTTLLHGKGAIGITPTKVTIGNSEDTGYIVSAGEDRIELQQGSTDSITITFRGDTAHVNATVAAWDFVPPLNSSSVTGFWKTTGNSGTNTTDNFLGNTDSIDFVIKTDATERLRLNAGGGGNMELNGKNFQITDTVNNLAIGIDNSLGVASARLIATHATSEYSMAVNEYGAFVTHTHLPNSLLNGFLSIVDYENSLVRNSGDGRLLFISNTDNENILSIRDSVSARDISVISNTDSVITLLTNYSSKVKLVDDAILGIYSDAVKWRIDSSGLFTIGSLDSATIYAIAPVNGTQVFCSDCTGNGITGRIVAYIGAAWRRLLFD